MISVYDIGNEDFEKNGNAVLTPVSGSHTQVAGGGYNLRMVQPVDPEGKWAHLVPDAIVKAPVPVEEIENSYSGLEADIYVTTANNAEMRESPSAPERITYPAWQDTPDGYSVGSKVTYQGNNYQAIRGEGGTSITHNPPTHSDWKRIANYTTGATVIATFPAGTELYLVEDYNAGWLKVETITGLEGYIQKSKVEFSRHVTPEENPPREIREQLFRIEEAVVDNEAQTVNVTAKHVSYDLAGTLIKEVAVSQASPAMAISRMTEGLMIPYRGTIATNLTTDEDGTYTGEIKGKNGIYALLDPDKGIVHEFDARLVRDNWDIFVLKKTGANRGYTLRYGVNTRGITWKKSNTPLITRIVPIAKAEDGSDLYLPEVWIDSPLINDYAYIRMERLPVSGQVGKDKGTGDGSTWTEADLLDEMRTKAEEQYTVNHVDQVVHEVTVQIEQLESTAEYAWMKNLKQLLLYDVVTAVDERIGLNVELYVSELEYDFVQEKVTGIKLTNIQDMNVRTVAGYNMMNNSISPEKLTDEVAQVIAEKTMDMIG